MPSVSICATRTVTRAQCEGSGNGLGTLGGSGVLGSGLAVLGGSTVLGGGGVLGGSDGDGAPPLAAAAAP